MSAQSKLEEEIGLLADLPREELVMRWHRIYRRPPPKGVKRGLLERAIAWHLQARHLGGLSPSIKRQLREAVDRDRDGLDTDASTRARPSVVSSPLPQAPASVMRRSTNGVPGMAAWCLRLQFEIA
jgi:hypothetical protein